MTKPVPASDEVVLYWRPGCPFCIKLRAQLRFSRRRYTEVNIWVSPDAAAYVRSVADGNETVPTVSVAGHPLVNPSRRELLLPPENAPRRRCDSDAPHPPMTPGPGRPGRTSVNAHSAGAGVYGLTGNS